MENICEEEIKQGEKVSTEEDEDSIITSSLPTKPEENNIKPPAVHSDLNHKSKIPNNSLSTIPLSSNQSISSKRDSKRPSTVNKPLVEKKEPEDSCKCTIL